LFYPTGNHVGTIARSTKTIWSWLAVLHYPHSNKCPTKTPVSVARREEYWYYQIEYYNDNKDDYNERLKPTEIFK
jgi:hypothetical protein